jgi:hypothetical protein
LWRIPTARMIEQTARWVIRGSRLLSTFSGLTND